MRSSHDCQAPGCFAMALAAILTTATLVLPGAASAAPERSPSAVTRYQPRCESDVACEVWRQFRSQRPFPVQTIAGQVLGDRLVLVFSEPTLPAAELGPLLSALFGDELRSIKARRWFIGADGWLDDVVIMVDWPGRAPAEDVLRDELLRNRLSLVAQALWGTSFGLQVEPIERDYAGLARASAPNLDPRATELAAWLRDPQMRWRRIDNEEPARPLAQWRAAAAEGAFVSADGRLTLLMLAAESLDIARTDPAQFARRWRARFRHFAVATDAVIGAGWAGSGPLQIVGRFRASSLAATAPLRFETFAMLARVGTSALAQSYERGTPFAGRLDEGRFGGTDWAPIYLSDALIDTEFGALLNITDQMLKSWSSAGDIDYLYFDYPLRPAPGQFAFGAESIIDIVKRENNSSRVLYNWNTSGAASVVSFNDTAVLTPTQTGALPVTYGAEAVPGGGVVTGQLRNLLDRERAAYRYFAELRDPNLARVVSYSVVYQALDAFRLSRAPAAGAHTNTTTRDLREGEARRAATEVLVADVAMVIDDLVAPNARARHATDQARRMTELAQTRGEVSAALRAEIAQRAQEAATRALGDAPERLARVQAAHPRLRDAKTLAGFLVDRHGESSKLSLGHSLRVGAFNAEVDRFNAGVRARTLAGAAAHLARGRLDLAQVELERDGQQMRTLLADVAGIADAVAAAIARSRALDATRIRFVNAAFAQPAGWIRTPSIVVSWHTRHSNYVGGHNLDANALRIEVDPTLSVATVVRTPAGRVLRVPPAQADTARSRASQLARQIEHEKVDIAEVRQSLAQAVAAPPRPISAALQVEAPLPLHALSRHAGRAPLDDAALRSQMLASFDLHGMPAGLAMRDAQGHFIVATRVDKRAQCCDRLLDLASLRDRLVELKDRGDVMLVNFNEGQARALARNIGVARDDPSLVAAVGGSGGRKPPVDGQVHVIAGNGAEPPRGSGGGGRPAGAAGPDAGTPPGGRGPAGGSPGGPPGRPPGRGGPGDPGEPYLVSITPDRGTVLDVLVASQKPRRLDLDPVRLEGAAAERDLARLRDTTMSKEVRAQLEWHAATDGDPVVFKLRWHALAPDAPAFESRVVAGVDPAQPARGIDVVEAAIAAARGSRREQTTSDLQARVRDYVTRHRDGKSVWRLFSLAEESQLSYLLSRLEPGLSIAGE